MMKKKKKKHEETKMWMNKKTQLSKQKIRLLFFFQLLLTPVKETYGGQSKNLCPLFFIKFYFFIKWIA